MQEAPVLVIDVNDLDFLARPDDLQFILEKIHTTLAQHTPSATPVSPSPTVPSVNGFLAAYQQFHRQLDASKGFGSDPYFNYLLLTEEIGELATALARTWRTAEKIHDTGKKRKEAHQEAIAQHRSVIRDELADILAYIIKLANYTGIDLEDAYLEKMRQNVQRTWEL